MRSAVARARAALLRYRAELEQVHAHLNQAHADLEQAHAAHISEIDQILKELEADVAGMPKIPLRNLILSAVQRAPSRGKTRAQIIKFIEQHFGIKANKSTVTVTLNRLQSQGLIEFVDGLWYPI
jgi:multidrug resistance efflux pump